MWQIMAWGVNVILKKKLVRCSIVRPYWITPLSQLDLNFKGRFRKF
jgi:hypothetical protein